MLLFADESEALTHPYLARAWAKCGADLRVQAPGQACARTQRHRSCLARSESASSGPPDLHRYRRSRPGHPRRRNHLEHRAKRQSVGPTENLCLVTEARLTVGRRVVQADDRRQHGPRALSRLLASVKSVSKSTRCRIGVGSVSEAEIQRRQLLRARLLGLMCGSAQRRGNAPRPSTTRSGLGEERLRPIAAVKSLGRWTPTVPPATLDAKLQRIADCGADAPRDDLVRSLLHAYAACLSPAEACEAALVTLDARIEVRGAIRNRLRRLGNEGIGVPELDGLARRLLDLRPAESKTRLRVDALLSHLFPVLSPPIRQEILDRWRDRGTREAGARWLKAIADDDLLFGVAAVLDYWRESGDWRAARILAYRADPAMLAEILPDFLKAGVQGSIVGKAALRTASISAEDWTKIRTTLPATYAYICAKTGRVVSEAEALALVLESDPFEERGLAIWAIGQMGLWSVLEQVRVAEDDRSRWIELRVPRADARVRSRRAARPR